MRKASLLIIVLQSLLLFSSPSVNSFVPLRLPRRYQPARTARRQESAQQGGIYKGITRSTVPHIRCAGTELAPKGKSDFDATFVGSSGTTRGTVLGVLVVVSVAAGGSFLAIASLFRIFGYGRTRGSVAPQPSPRRTPPASPSTTFVRRATKMLGAWRCSGSTNSELIKNLVDANLIRSPRVAKAMQATDRGFYTPHDAYEDRPQPIGFRATISAPHMHAHALEVLSPVIPAEGGRVLDVGCGSGYLTGALARLVGETGFVYGMDYIPSLIGLTKTNLEKDDESLLASRRVSLLTGDGWKGWAEKGPYDAIHVGAAAETIPEDLVSQLKVGGRMVVPVGPQSSSQMLIQVDRIKDTGPISESYTTEGLMAVVYVPLVST